MPNHLFDINLISLDVFHKPFHPVFQPFRSFCRTVLDVPSSVSNVMQMEYLRHLRTKNPSVSEHLYDTVE